MARSTHYVLPIYLSTVHLYIPHHFRTYMQLVTYVWYVLALWARKRLNGNTRCLLLHRHPVQGRAAGAMPNAIPTVPL